MIALLATALASGCEQTTLGELAATPGPAVFVLGERMGTQPDLARAARLVSKLRGTGAPVTVALQALPPDRQPVLDRYAKGELQSVDLPGLLDWGAANGFPYGAYEQLVTGAAWGGEVIAIGAPVEARPADTPVPIPPGYIAILQDGMAGHPMPVPLESAFVQTVTWLDFRLARSAIEGWKGEGYLVIVADRTHVEGGKGIGWQAQRLTEAPVKSVLLGGPGSCYDKDLYL
ncbi:MAG: ChaN family lipoprotein [Alphaproteobacteria bacterium]|nr:ChaN family lipoprotein [Alphaproteobacteria bacterium]